MFIRQSAYSFFAMLVFTGGCSSNAYTPKEYVQWAAGSKSGLQREVALNRQQYQLQYMTPELTAIASLNCTEANQHCDSVVEVLKKEGVHRFQLRMKTEGLDDIFDAFSPAEYAAKVAYASFPIRQDFSLIEGADTVSPGFFHVERSFGITPYTVFLLHFDAKEQAAGEDLILVYDDKLFDNGRMIFRIKPQKNIAIKWNNKS